MFNVLNYLESSALKFPNKIAVIEEEKNTTYKELCDMSKRIGSYFANKNISNELVLVFMDKGIDTLISFFGSIYANCYYSLINPELPEVRINSIKQTTNAKYVITNDEYKETAQKYFNDLEILNISDLKKIPIDEEILNQYKKKHIDCDPLYVNFTSGSTGTPKGVVVSHRSVIDFIDKFTELFNFSSEDIIGNQAPFDFDVSVKDIYSAIKVGATLVVIPKKYFSSPSKLLDYICDNNVTTLTWAVSALCLITTFHGLDYKTPATVNKVIFSGEVMPIKHLKQWMEHLPNTMFVNVYGPTEITCNCTYHVIDRNRDYEDKIPIGFPFPNERIYLLGEDNKLITNQNEVGEICVGGTCLGLGYYNNKEETNKVFVQNPNNQIYLDMIYKTGDLGYYNQGNELVFNGRKDFQIKFQGHRIELEEIDKALMKVDNVIRSCTIFQEEKSKLYGFYIGKIDPKELHLKLKELLPVYMIPSKLIQMDEFPMTKNGKTDRKKLMELKEQTK